MAVVSLWSTVSVKSHIHPTVVGVRRIERGRTYCCLPLRKVFRCFSLSLLCETERKRNVPLHGSESNLRANSRQRDFAGHLICTRCTQLKKIIGLSLLKVYNKEDHGRCQSGGSGSFALPTASSQGQLKALDSYFSKLNNDMNEQVRSCGNDCDTEENHLGPSLLEGKLTGFGTKSNQYRRKTTLDSLDNYFGELNTGYSGKEEMMVELNSFEHLKIMDDEASQVVFDDENAKGLRTNDEASDFYLINLLVAINIAVFLFEIASPVRNSELEQLSLPLIYGGKINKLILTGEWWRLLTPMFLHSGFPHIALGCWVLLTFGPQVCRGYGPLTFFLMYVLGGICGNLTSFIHTPELTVCGTAPVFAIIGAWLVYQIQNKQVVEKEVSEIMFWKAVIATALSFVLSNFGRIDDWTHLVAAFSGIIFGYLTCPTLQLLDNLSSKNGQKQQGIALLHQKADPCKSLLIFTLSVLILSCLAFVYVPQLEELGLDGLV
ncbi:RHOMBOID-like protein 9, chloroplastic isoform X3 [Iris pallida]|uniref:RHOMBOID-like protein 9, chloroplastic isoform X3 n=1 Tax=Iris pallida TaxID=29817 RepID=A0AAX6G0X7_IRIPA|nr:RHOMBOID-like protein 9, chloroplastic isoform X3 [Iris pallida]